VEEPHGQPFRSASHTARLSVELLLPRRRRPAEHRGHSGHMQFLGRSAMSAGADGTLVSRIMAASSTLEIEVCGDCAVGYGDLRPLARDGVWQ
jgi:hypothetical protein